MSCTRERKVSISSEEAEVFTYVPEMSEDWEMKPLTADCKWISYREEVKASRLLLSEPVLSTLWRRRQADRFREL
eukprot:Skav224946  [mRNA]  locus=scaffold1474:227587:232348:- [translate_table: standard]